MFRRILAGWFVGAFLAHAQVAEKRKIAGVVYHLVKADPEKVRIFWKDDQGEIMRTFDAVEGHMRKHQLRARVLMNGGIFEPGGIPTGLLVQEGVTSHPVNRKKGEGNFYLLPNGVFLIGDGGAAVVSTAEYPPKGVVVREAVQSGPLLLRRGAIHRAFNPNSKWNLHRNGVGVDAEGKVIFLMSDFHSPKFPTLHDFAHAFLAVGCKDALFLDGDLSQMRFSGEPRKGSNRFGSVIAVLEKETSRDQ